MTTFVLRRLLQTIPVLFVTSVVVFTVIHMIPGDPALNLAGADASPAEVQAVAARLGLDKPLVQQYLIYISNALRGDLGSSYISGLSVGSLIARAAPATIQLSVSSFIAALAIGVPLGIIAGLFPNSPVDFFLAGYAAVMHGVPNFVFAVMYLLLFTVTLGWLPPGGEVAFTSDPIEAVRHLALPVLTLALPISTIYGRFVRTAILETISQDYVRTARAKGLQESAVVWRHVLRNAMLPLVTIVGIQFGRLLGGTVITESIFAWPGMGRLALNAIGQRDYLLFQSIMLLLVLSSVFMNLIVELTYGFLDPRISRR